MLPELFKKVGICISNFLIVDDTHLKFRNHISFWPFPHQVLWNLPTKNIHPMNKEDCPKSRQYVKTSLTKEIPIESKIWRAILFLVKHSSSVNWIIWLPPWCPTWEIHPTYPEESFWNITKSMSFSVAGLKLQGDPNQNFRFQMAITLKLNTSDPMLVKPKCVWEAVVLFWKIVNKQLKNVNKFSKIEKNYRLSNAFWLHQYRVKNA